MATEKRKEFLLKQGYQLELITFLEQCSISKHMLWFLNQYKGNEQLFNEAHISMINKHIESHGKNKFNTIAEAFKSAECEFSKRQKERSDILHSFDDEYFIVALKCEDLALEGISMSNCVGNYVTKISDRELAILALKDKNANTICHFEVLKNGMISQNFEKGNMPVRHKYWKYIYEFFSKNSKEIPDSKHLGFGWQASIGYNIIQANCMIPRKISKTINQYGEVENNMESVCFIKRFSTGIPTFEFCGLEKDELIKKIDDMKSKIIEAIDNISASIKMTEGCNMFLSDSMKEKIFGDGKYYMKGDKYTFHDMLVFDNNNGIAFENRDAEVGILEEPEAQLDNNMQDGEERRAPEDIQADEPRRGRVLRQRVQEDMPMPIRERLNPQRIRENGEVVRVRPDGTDELLGIENEDFENAVPDNAYVGLDNRHNAIDAI